MASNLSTKLGKRRKRPELKTFIMLVMLKLRGPIGRYRLKEMLDLSDQEGLVRLMLSDLKHESLVTTGKTGCKLTKKGEEILERILEKHGIVEIREAHLESLKIGAESFIFQCRGLSMPKSITSLRDVAVRHGSSGAIIMFYDKGTLKVPEVYSNLEDEYPDVVGDFHKTLKLSDCDIILVSFANDKWRALEGGFSIAISLQQGLC
jgi:hypothetical protein